MGLWLGDPRAAGVHQPRRSRGFFEIVWEKGQHILMEWFGCFLAPWQMMEKVISSSLCVFSSGSFLPPLPQHSDSERVTADASLAPVNSDVALLCEPTQAWFIIPVHWIDTAHSCLDAIPSWDASLPPSTYPRVPAPSSFPYSFPETWPDDLEVLRYLGVSGLGPTSSSPSSGSNSTSSLDGYHLPALCFFSIIWAVSMLQSKAVQLAGQDHSVFPSFETESSRSEDCQRASYWVIHAFLINHIWLP